MKHGSQQRFSIRKYSFGAASVLIASLTFLGGQAQADSLIETKTSTEDSSVVSYDFHAVSQTETNSVIPEFSTEMSSVENRDIDSKKNQTPPSSVLTKTTVESQETSSPSSSKAVETSNTQVDSSQDNSVSGFRTVGRLNIQSDLPSSGTYVFQENANVQNAPKLSSSVLATYEKGQSVNYDSIVSGDNRLWLSYISTTGFRRYVVLPAQNTSGQTTDSAVANTLNALAPQGIYTFSKTAGVKNEARIASPDVATYNPGQSVRYDRVLSADNHRWLSYISYSGARRYVAVEKLAQPTKPVTPEVKVEKTGRISTANVSASGFDVLVSNVNHPDGIKEVLVPTWSEKNGQDDIIWHKAVKQNDGSYKVRVSSSQHKNETGSYQVHLRYLTNKNQNVYIAETTALVPYVPLVEKTGNLSISKVTSSGFDVVITNVNHPDGVKEVLVPSWSEKNGQDDLIWHKAVKQMDGSYKVRVSSSQHKNETGSYQVHLRYLTNKNQNIYIAETKILLPKGIQISASEVDSNSFQVRLTGLGNKPDVKEVLTPIWTNRNDQDDIIWYTAQPQADGSYLSVVNYKNHGNETGTYIVHAYYRNTAGQLISLPETSFTPSIQDKVGTVTISTVDQSNQTFTTVIKNIGHPEGVKGVQVAVWSEKNGQDDLKWYDAFKQSDGSYKAVTHLMTHDYVNGPYQVHVYYVLSSGKLYGLSASQIMVEVNTPSRYSKAINGKTFTLVGGFNPTTQKLKELVEAIRSLETQGYNMGFSMIDVTTKKGIEYRADQTYYSASTIKGPFVASLVSKNPGSINQSKPTMLEVLTQSSNEGYSQLRTIYGASSIYSWAREAGLSESKVQALYPYLTPRDLMGLWTQNYKYFTTSDQGREIATWFEKPNLSPIKSVLGSQYKTFSKAGWIGGWGYHAANDAGIVRTSKGDYILSIMSNADGKLGLLNPAVRALNEIHKQI